MRRLRAVRGLPVRDKHRIDETVEGVSQAEPVHAGTTQSELGVEVVPKPRSRRLHPRALWWAAGTAVCAMLAAGGVIAVNALAAPASIVEPQRDLSTAPIESGTLSGTKAAPGTLDFADSRDLPSNLPGTVTWLPGTGSQIGLGDPLFRTDDIGVYLFHGALPAWRAFGRGMDDGADVRQLEAALRTLGFFDREPDAHFDWYTEQGIRDWQEATAQRKTGSIDFGRVVFAPTDVRIAETLAAIGSKVAPGTAVIRISGLTKEVAATLKLADQRLGVAGAPVTVSLPGGESATGTITAVGQPTERQVDGKTTVVIPLTITLDDPAAAEGIQRASVTVQVPSEAREDVLSVPIDALLALPGGEFGVEIVHEDGSTKRIPVTTGLFAGGRVEVSGKGIGAGLEVMVPER